MRHAATLVFAAGLLLLTAEPGMASPASRELVQQGLADMQARRYEAALQKFEEAARADPADARTVYFFQGAALNRLGRQEEALARLERAVQMGSPHPELPFELGWALLGVGRWRDAIPQLERAELQSPGRGQTSEFLGRAYLALGDLTRAEQYLEEALRRDPGLAPTVRLALAAVAARRGDQAAVRAQAQRLQLEAPDSPIARRLQEAAPLVPPAPAAAKPWQVVVSLSGGYNSNVIALGDTIPLPSDISQKHAYFARGTLGASYDWRLGARDSLTAGYNAQIDLYADLSEANFLDQVWYLDYRHAFTSDLAAALRVSDNFSLLDGDAFRNQVGIRPAVGYRISSWSLLELHYALGINDYYVDDVPPVQDRDGLGHQVGLTWFAAIPGTQLLLRAGAFYGRYEADGADFDFDSIGLFVGLNVPLFWQIVADVSYIHLFDRYDNPNSLAGPTGFGFKRDDDGDFFSVQLTRPILDWLSVYVRYDYSRNDSNVPFYEYDQHVVSSGVVARF
jgi:tetratricopeptide (TPR) repeat protein